MWYPSSLFAVLCYFHILCRLNMRMYIQMYNHKSQMWHIFTSFFMKTLVICFTFLLWIHCYWACFCFSFVACTLYEYLNLLRPCVIEVKTRGMENDEWKLPTCKPSFVLNYMFIFLSRIPYFCLCQKHKCVTILCMFRLTLRETKNNLLRKQQFFLSSFGALEFLIM